MKKNPHYLTKSEVFRWYWLKNFASKLPNYKVLFNLSQDKVDKVTADSQCVDKVMLFLEKLQKIMRETVLFKNNLFDTSPPNPEVSSTLGPFEDVLPEAITSLPNLMKNAIQVAEEILANANMTAIIREDLQLNKPTETEAREASGNAHKEIVTDRPVVKAELNGDLISLKIKRGNRFKRLNAAVYACRTDDDVFSLHTISNKGTVTDRAVFANGVNRVVYTYRVQMQDGDVAVGEPSESVSVVVFKPLGMA